MKPGDRVTVVQSADDHEIRLIGNGVFEGMFNPAVDAGEAKGPFCTDPECIACKNPRIRLDKGGVVYGYQVWFMPEGQIKKMQAAYPFANMVEVEGPKNPEPKEPDPTDINIITDVVPKSKPMLH